MNRFLLALPLIACCGSVSAQSSLPEVMRAGKLPAPDGPNAQTKAQEPECKTLTSGSTFCKVTRNGAMRWVLQGKLRADFKVGDAFPVYQHSMLMDLRRYKLPAVTGAWRYYVLRGTIYRVDNATKKVIEVVGPTYAR
ncbi:hypothetical protein [uncultured Thioclava sp.]|uniref:hypothetical protein n=1 Tax=uncultured Thioclava sp. TaxID=473858 RepID=UPI0025DAFEAD|nr:hypothetical protein [uncultured Thioclava sp.]